VPPITELTRIEPVLLSRLEHQGVFTTGILLEVSETPTRRQNLADQVAATTNDVLAWRDEALMLNLAGFGEDEHQLFIQARIDNWEYLRRAFDSQSEFFEFMLPTHAKAWSPDGFTWDNSGHKTLCSWFGFMLRVKETAPFTKFQFARYLDDKKIYNRMIFGGNLVRQPMFMQLKKDRIDAYRVVGDLSGADLIMNQSLWIGVYPGLTREMLDYMVETVADFVKQF